MVFVPQEDVGLLLGKLQLWRRTSVLWFDDAIRRRGNPQKRTNLLHAGQRAVALQVLRYIACYCWADFDYHVPRRLKRLQHIGRHSQRAGEASPASIERVLAENLGGRCCHASNVGFPYLSGFASVKALASSYVSNGPMRSGSVG